MEAFTSFLANNYIWFLVVTLILFFALVGYIVDAKEIKSGKRKTEEKIIDYSSVDTNKSLNESLKEEAGSLNLDDYQSSKESTSTKETTEVEALVIEEPKEEPEKKEKTKKKKEKKTTKKVTKEEEKVEEIKEPVKEETKELETISLGEDSSMQELPDLDEGEEKNFESEF